MDLNRLRFSVLISGIFAAPLLFFSTQFSPWSEGPVSRAAILIQDISYPFAWVWHESSTGLDNAWERYINLSGKSHENTLLQAENLKLKSSQLNYDELLIELNRLRSLAGFTQVMTDKIVAAEVITGQKALPFRTIRVSKGSDAGVKIGMPAIASAGAIGRVIRVGVYFSDIQLLVDFDSNIDVFVQRNRIRGVLGGYSNESCRLKLQRSSEVRIGDTLATSGIVGSFPKGIPVGKIVRISFESDDVSQLITVAPWVEPHLIEEVIILLREDPELGRIAEAGGADWFDKSLNPTLNEKRTTK